MMIDSDRDIPKQKTNVNSNHLMTPKPAQSQKMGSYIKMMALSPQANTTSIYITN